MKLTDYFQNDAYTIIDRRAEKIDVTPPQGAIIELRRSSREAFASLPSVSVYPVAIVQENGRLFIMSAGGSGVIWVCGEPSEKQIEVMMRVYRVLRSMGADFYYSQIEGLSFL